MKKKTNAQLSPIARNMNKKVSLENRADDLIIEVNNLIFDIRKAKAFNLLRLFLARLANFCK